MKLILEMPQLKSVKNETDDQNDELCLETKDGVAIQEEKIETKDDNPDVKDNDVYAFKETDSQGTFFFIIYFWSLNFEF